MELNSSGWANSAVGAGPVCPKGEFLPGMLPCGFVVRARCNDFVDQGVQLFAIDGGCLGRQPVWPDKGFKRQDFALPAQFGPAIPRNDSPELAVLIGRSAPSY